MVKTVKITADTPRGFKIVNADDPRAQNAAPKAKPDTSKAALVAALEAQGVEVDRRWGIAKLQEALSEMEG